MAEGPNATVVLTHGRDQPFHNPDEEGVQWANALRWGLQRAGASYYDLVQPRFAFYGDLWRPDTDPKELEGSFASDPTTDTATELAYELLQQMDGDLVGPEIGTTYTLQNLVSLLDSYLHIGEIALATILTDIGDYLNKSPLRRAAIERIARVIEEADPPVILLAHSLGTVVAYDLLLRKVDLPVSAFVSFGSILGFATIRKRVALTDGSTPFPRQLSRWINIYSKSDFATSVREIAAFYPSAQGQRVEDVKAIGRAAKPWKPMAGHDPLVYLSSMALCKSLRSILESTNYATT